jgi:hypothetical protein
MNQIPKQLNKLSLTTNDLYDNLSVPNDIESWQVFVSERLLDKQCQEWLNSLRRDYRLKINAKTKKGFLVIY